MLPAEPISQLALRVGWGSRASPAVGLLAQPCMHMHTFPQDDKCRYAAPHLSPLPPSLK
jgi:hypothetical protein